MEVDQISFVVHETQAALRRLNEALSQMGVALSSPSPDLKRLSDHLAIAYENTYFVDLAVTSSALLFRDDYATATPVSEIRIYDALHRNVKRMQMIAKGQRKAIVVSGSTARRAQVFPCFDLLFYLFLDNAVKYSMPGGRIGVDVIELGNEVVFKIKNVGPMLNSEEIEAVLRVSNRGKLAELAGRKGRGLGLPLAQHICNINGVEMTVKPSTEKRLELSGVSFSDFLVEIRVPVIG